MKEQVALTNMEKIAISGLVYQHVIQNVTMRDLPWAETWKMCHPDSITQAYQRQRENARQWKQTRLFLDYWEDCMVRITEHIAVERDKAVDEQMRQMEEVEGVAYDETTDEDGNVIKRRKQKLKVDYTDRNELINQLNLKLNEVKDDKMHLDLLKTIADLMRFKEDTPDKQNADIMRFYTPLTCPDCPLYKAKQKELEEAGEI